MASYEIEIKSLLGSLDKKQKVLDDLHRIYPDTKFLSKNKQLNHYFIDGDFEKLNELLAPYLSSEQKEGLIDIISNGSDFSVRTRLIDEQDPIFVVKASVDEGTSHNTVSRLEFEAQVSGIILEGLDQLLLDAGFTYQAKWSREREEYSGGEVTICFDKNAGYGYLAEFEKVVDDESYLSHAKEELKKFMKKLSVDELPQERLERMFAHYNEHWPKYYGTDNIFVIE
tara:strand:- start:12522 stop:13202 length:681 start_codon:yes stop_codon:yes gene_type:complete